MNRGDNVQRWPRYFSRARDLGLRSQMGLRLYAERETVGGLNLYATRDVNIDAEVVHVAQLFADHAALALGKARHEDDLRAATMSQRAIGQAVGLVMARYDLSSDGRSNSLCGCP